jgi:cell wall-associated NlpC family hydrolase
MTATPLNFVAAARSLIGAKWRHRGRKPWAVDCIGLVILAGQQCGLDFRDEGGYGREPWEDRLRRALLDRCGPPVAERAPGCIALIRWAQGEPSHVAIVGDHPSGGLSLIHAHTLTGVVEVGLSGRYLNCIVETYRPRFDT